MRKNWFIEIGPDIEKFKKGIWRKITPDKKVEYAWDMVVEAMELKNTRNKLRFKKVLVFPGKK